MYLLSPCSMLNFWNYISHGYFDCMLSSTLVDSVTLFLIFYHYFFFLFSSIEDWRNHQNASNRRAWDTRQSWWEVYPSNCSLYICYGANKENLLNKLLHVAINCLILMTSVFDLGVLLVTTWGWLNLENTNQTNWKDWRPY